MLIFSTGFSVGFVFELGKGALKISTYEDDKFSSEKISRNSLNFIGNIKI